MSEHTPQILSHFSGERAIFGIRGRVMKFERIIQGLDWDVPTPVTRNHIAGNAKQPWPSIFSLQLGERFQGSEEGLLSCIFSVLTVSQSSKTKLINRVVATIVDRFKSSPCL